MPGRIHDAELQDARAGLHALRDGLDYIGRLQAELRSASRVVERSPEPLDVGELLRQSCALAGRPAGVSLHIEVAPDAPERVFADRVAVTRILVNLLRNAAESLLRGGGRSIWLRALAEPSGADGSQPSASAMSPSPAAQSRRPSGRLLVETPALWISVEDDGPGVAEADRARLFHPGFSTRPDGAGLGLATSRTLALREGGELWLDATSADRGARFVVRLPVGGVGVAP